MLVKGMTVLLGKIHYVESNLSNTTATCRIRKVIIFI